MLKRIVVNIILAFGILPAVNPFIVYLNAASFNFDFNPIQFAGGMKAFYHIYWGYGVFYYSIIILVFVLGIYNWCIVRKVRNTKIPFLPWLKFIIFLALYVLVTFLSNSDIYYLGGTQELLQKIIVLAVLSAVMVTLHYRLIDRRYERKVMERASTEAETK